MHMHICMQHTHGNIHDNMHSMTVEHIAQTHEHAHEHVFFEHEHEHDVCVI